MRSSAFPDPGTPDYLGLPLRRFLDLLSAGEAVPGGGAAAALAVALGASLCAMAARLSAERLAGRAGLAEHLAEDAERLRDNVAPLCQADARAYGRVIDALRMPARPDPARRRQAVADALSGAAAVPLRVVEIAAGVAGLAARLAEEGNPSLRGDAIAAALLADAGARAAAVLVRINLAHARRDTRLPELERLLEKTAASASQAQSYAP